MRVLELFSGIGGMHLALKESGIQSEVIAAADINTVANSVYKYNFPSTRLLQNNVQSFTASFIDSLDPNIILMSPPCQPFTRVGLQKDNQDKRSCGLLHLIEILPHLKCQLKFILLENVKGFEKSESRELLVNCLHSLNFACAEYLLSPDKCVGIPNSRLRYYLLARKADTKNVSGCSDAVPKTSFPNVEVIDANLSIKCIQDILELPDYLEEWYAEYLLSREELAKRGPLYDIVYAHSTRSCCFTKAYSRFAEGTGSIFCPKSENDVMLAFQNKSLDEIVSLKLRYFTPKEVSRLMAFPESFEFPPHLSRKQMYMLLGNSINIKLVAGLIRFLCHQNT